MAYYTLMNPVTVQRISLPACKTEQADLVTRLWAEFHRLNETYCGGKLALSEIRFSMRKQYGGYYRPSERLIVLSWQAYLEYGWDETLETFRHEVAHIAHPNHSAAFWALAFELGCTRKYAQPPKAPRSHTYRYIYECPVCQSRYYRRKRLTRSSCGRCDRQFNPRFLLRLVK